MSSLPKPVQHVVADPIPEHIQKMFDESQSGAQHYHHNHDHDHAQSVNEGHTHDHAAGYMDAYGLNDGWGN